MTMMRKMQPSGLAMAVALAALWNANAAQAQDAKGTATDTPPAQQNAADRSPLGQDIVVTARKREERAQEIPIAISAFSGSALAARGVERIDGISNFSPNMTFQNNPAFGGSSSAAVYIRGIGQKDVVPTVEPGVGIYVDGIYVARSTGAILDLADVERVEVLRGPQGTLFGRNSIGGAISISTTKPSNDNFASGEVTIGSFNRIDAKASVNLALSDRLFIKLSGASMLRDGYVRRTFDDLDLGNINKKTGRLQLRWKATDALEVNLSVDGTLDRNNGPAATLSAVSFASRRFDPANPRAAAPTDNFTLLNNYFATLRGVAPCISFSPYNPQASSAAACFTDRFVGDRRTDGGTLPQYSRVDTWGASGTIEWDLGGVTLKSLTAYREMKERSARDGDHSPLTIAHYVTSVDQNQFSQELQLLGQNDANTFKYVAGAYYFHEGGAGINLLDFTPVLLQSGGYFKTKSYAAFGQATWTFLPRLDLTVGLRYTRDQKQFLPDQYIITDRTPGQTLIAASPNTPKTRILPYETVTRTDPAFTPSVNLAWKIDRNFMVYASYSKGFKSGGFVQRVFPPLATAPQFAPEKATAYELGFKSSLFDRRLTLNGAIFYTRYNDLQVQVFSGIAPVTKNAAQAEIRGAELEARLSPGSGIFLEASAGYLDPSYRSVDAAAIELSTSSRFERISKWTLSAAASKTFELDAFDITPRLDWSYRSGFFMDALNSPALYQKGYALLNATMTFGQKNGPLSIVAGVNNLTNTHYTETGIYGSSFGLYEQVWNRPREWRVTAKWKIGG